MEGTVRVEIGDVVSISRGEFTYKARVFSITETYDAVKYGVIDKDGNINSLEREQFKLIAKADKVPERVVKKEDETEEEFMTNNEETNEDLVNSPKHYTDTSMECIDAMLLILGYEYTIAHCIGTAFKYLWRYRNKENPQRDLDKARWYVDKGESLCYRAMLDVTDKVNGRFLLERLGILSKQIDKYDDELYEEAKKREEEEGENEYE